jgi:heterodisulfide reductase subunit A-like polyferredoxin
MTAALTLSNQGVGVDLIEREDALGGRLRDIRYLVRVGKDAGQADGPDLYWQNARDYRRELVSKIEEDPKINVHLDTDLIEMTGFKGHFQSTLSGPHGNLTVQHGATIVATGAQEYRGDDYLYGSHPDIVTQQEFETLLAENAPGTSALPRSAIMIQCVGPAEQYCSRTCCTNALKNALKLKQLDSSAQVVVLYRDIRTYGFNERLYTEARRAGVLFVHYDAENKPEVSVSNSNRIEVSVWEAQLGRRMSWSPDKVVLSMPMVPADGSEELAKRLKVSVDLDGWFMEAHVKLRPVDFATEGLFMAGSAHYPKLVEEAIAQAQAAAGRAGTILAQDALKVGGAIAQVKAESCVGCLTCIRACPFGVPRIKIDVTGVGHISGAAYIEPAQCQGCGICVGECPAKAIELMHYRDCQQEAKVEALLETY